MKFISIHGELLNVDHISTVGPLDPSKESMGCYVVSTGGVTRTYLGVTVDRFASMISGDCLIEDYEGEYQDAARLY